MPEPFRVLTSPVRLTGELHVAHLATLASVDALLRRARSEGAEVSWQAATLAGDLGSQADVERELTRQGTSRADLGRDAFIDRVRTQESEARDQVAADLASIGIDADLETDALDTEPVARAARTAFVRLYEEGLLTRQERVVATCPRCRTVVDPADAIPILLDAEIITLKLGPPEATGPQVAFEVEVDLIAPELLDGVVAIVVPEDHPAAGSQVEVPVAHTVVPVIAEAGVESPELVIPSHDEIGLDRARRLGLLPVDVLDADGVVRTEGPLQGLARFAARAAARQLITADGDVLVVRPGAEASARCRRCGTVLVPRRGRHWFLPMADLEVAAADAVRQGGVVFAPPAARDELLDRAGLGGDWCLSHQVWAGQPVPVAACLDCGQLAVSVEPSESCGKCMGTLVAEDDVLDARFVGAVWPLATAGWPSSERGPEEMAPSSTLVVGPSGIVKWVLPMAALAVRLVNVVPFCTVAAHHVVATEEDPDPRLPVDLAAIVRDEGPRVVRLALLAGGLDLDAARALVASIDEPPLGANDIDDLVTAYDLAFAAGSPGDVLPVLAATLAAGISPDAVDRVKALAAPSSAIEEPFGRDYPQHTWVSAPKLARVTYEQALDWLDQRVNREAVSAPDAAFKLEGVRELVGLMADPQRQYPVLHVTGTNGKTSTARILTALLQAKGLSVGTFTSPHLERVNERMEWNGEPISDGAFAEVITALAELEPLLEHTPTWFELVTVAAMRWFSDIAVDVAVIEVGLGGRYDATNVADATVAVVTNVGIDHLEFIGPTREDIAFEKAGIVKPGSTLVLGETDAAIIPIFERENAEVVWKRGTDFGCTSNTVAHAGRLLGLRTPGATYTDVFLALHGAHQGDNAAIALAAAEAFFAEPLTDEVVAEAFATVRSPGRMEIVDRRPLVVLDGAHNPAGAKAAAATLDEEFATAEGRVIVFGCFSGKDPAEMLTALGATSAKLVVAVAPPWPRALPASDIVAAADGLGIAAVAASSVAAALGVARDAASADDLILVTGSLYLVGAARAALT